MKNVMNDPILTETITTATRCYRLIHDIYVLLDAGDRQVLSALGLTASQYRILVLLANGPSHRMTDLSDMMLCARSTVTRLIDTLESAHLVQRDPDEMDRRAQQVGLTTAGRDLLQRAQQAHDQSLADRLAPMTLNQQADLAQMLEQMRSRLRANLDS